MKSETLRVGVMLESPVSSAWVATVLSEIQSSDYARVDAILLAPTALSPLNTSLFQHYERWDYQRNKVAHDATAASDLSSLLSGVPSHLIEPVLGSPVEDQVDQIAAIGRLDLDVILRFSPTITQDLAGAARFGIWSFHFGHEGGVGDNAPLFWQVFDRTPVAPCSLQISSLAGRRTAYQGQAATDQASLYRTRNPVYWKIAAATLRALKSLSLAGTAYIESLPVASAAHNPDAGSRRVVSSMIMARFLAREASRWLRARFASLQSSAAPKWCIWIRRRTPEHSFDDSSGYHMMTSAEDRFYADPFLFERDGKTFLFFEDFRYPEGRAVISVCELDDDGRPGEPVEVLRRPYHLSYPFLFEDGGVVYMIPETRGNRAIELYRAVHFPTVWAQEADLISDIAAVDTTIESLDGRLWMFTSVSNGAYSNSDELWIYSSDSLKGTWKRHPKNPVVSDVQRARQAGMLFHEAGRLIRPSQDCGEAYGYALVFAEIVTLTETHYEERVIGRITPDQIPHAISNHTYNRTDRFEVTDRTLPASIANRGGA